MVPTVVVEQEPWVALECRRLMALALALVVAAEEP